SRYPPRALGVLKSNLGVALSNRWRTRRKPAFQSHQPPRAARELTCRTQAMMLAGKLTAALALALCSTGAVQAQKVSPNKPSTAGARVSAESLRRQQINDWTVGLAGGLLEGAPIRLATEISRVVNDGNDLHVLPIVTRGPTENLNDLLYLKGVDMAI